MKIVIIGGGFAGVKAALELSKVKKASVTLVSDRDHFLFYPALYATATGRSKRQSILPLSEIFKNSTVKIIHDTVTSIDASRRVIVAKENQLSYDRAVFALGVVTSYFGISGLDKYSYSIKSAPEIDRFKRHLHGELTSTHHLDKNYVIVGAGPTGVELSAALTHYLAKIARNHSIRHSKIRLSLVEAAPRVLPRMSERSSELVEKELQSIGVNVLTNKKVESEDDDSIIISGKDIPSQTVVWTSGVMNHPFFSEHPETFPLSKNGRVEVDGNLKVSKHVYVIGDNASTQYTGLAQTAIHDAKFVARAIESEINHKPIALYKPMRPPVVIPVGEDWAILEYGPIRVSGLLGSLLRRAADFIGYMDYFPILTAVKLLRSESQNEEDCLVCQ